MLWPNGSRTRPRISSNFGPRKAPTKGASSMHRGTDFTGFSTVRAIAAGSVQAVGTPAGWSGGGTQVWIRHDDGSLSRSLHLARYSVARGQRVSEGQPIGVMGSTGTATGVHLHLEIVPSGASSQVDPVAYIQGRISGSIASTGGNRTKRPTADIQRLVGANPDGIFGPDTRAKVKAWQKAHGLTADGIWGPASDARGFPARPKLKVDGVWGRDTTKALQAALSVKADGILGRGTITALQRKIGVKADGIEGPATRKALQKHLGVRQDGAWGPATARALQTRLNAGTF